MLEGFMGLLPDDPGGEEQNSSGGDEQNSSGGDEQNSSGGDEQNSSGGDEQNNPDGPSDWVRKQVERDEYGGTDGGDGNGGTHAGNGNGGDDTADAIDLDDVRFDKGNYPGGRDAIRAYIGKALGVMGITDPAARSRWAAGLEVGIFRESSFNPRTVCTWDTNAKGPVIGDGFKSNCSRGLMQTVPNTFALYHQPDTSNNIYDPVANICAGMNYLMGEYNVKRDGSNLTKVGQFNPKHTSGGY
jgi:hypothetical protein